MLLQNIYLSPYVISHLVEAAVGDGDGKSDFDVSRRQSLHAAGEVSGRGKSDVSFVNRSVK